MDYKTGSRIASKNQILCGEQVQLLCYTGLMENVESASYVDLNSPYKIGHKSLVSGHMLQQASEENLMRLREVQQELTGGRSMPAWGEEHICSYCDYEGLCRKSHLPQR